MSSLRREVGTAAGFLAAVLLSALPALAAHRSGYPDSPPPAHTGGFGEPTCHACHFDSDPNSGGAVLEVAGLPATYAPGARYAVSIVLASPGLETAGFQAAARFAYGTAEGRQAGRLIPSSERVAITASGEPPIEYIHHRIAGTVPSAPDTARWSFDWQAPETPAAPIVFHVAGNAGNGDNSQFGDLVATTSVKVLPPRADPR